MRLLYVFSALSFIGSLCFEMNEVPTHPLIIGTESIDPSLPSARVLILKTEGLNRKVGADRECRQGVGGGDRGGCCFLLLSMGKSRALKRFKRVLTPVCERSGTAGQVGGEWIKLVTDN